MKPVFNALSAVSALLMVLAFHQPLQAQPNRVLHNGRNLFVSGGNVAWISFGSDVGPGTTDLAQFESMFREVRDNGGNSMRIWLHPTGNNLAWSGNTVTGPGAGFTDDLRNILDLARTYDVSLMLCLWSFDMLRISNGTTTTGRNLAVLSDTTHLGSYLRNFLVPVATALKDHPAILAWEVCNEPEGMSQEFGWDGNLKVSMQRVQILVNRVAGAIKRVDPRLKVTNGAWSFKSTQDAIKQEAAKDMNYYRNDRLIAAGGDPDGTLDFYTVHYYDWAGTNLSPFHHPYDRWNLDKPLVVAEFYMKGAVFGIQADSLYKVLHRNGYAGAMAWQWVDYVQNRDNNTATWPNALRNMRYMRDNHLADVSNTYNGMRLESFTASRLEVEAGQAFQLGWTVRGAVSVTLNGQPVGPVQSRTETLQSDRRYVLIATAAGGRRDSAVQSIRVLTAQDVNRALLAPASAHTGTAAAAFDGDPATAWSGNGQAGFLAVELKETYQISRISVLFGNAFAADYQVEGSFDGVNWRVLSTVTGGDGGTDAFTFANPAEANRVRLVFPASGLQGASAPSVHELAVFGLLAPVQPPVPRLSAPAADVTVDNGITVTLTAAVVPGTQPTRRVIFYAGTDSLGQDTTVPYSFSWKTSRAGVFAVSAVAVTDGHRIQTASRTVTVNKTVQVRRFEAESAQRTGTLAVVNEGTASGGSFIRMDNDGTLTWPGLSIATAGEFTLRFGYRLPFDAKTQYINVNGTRVAELVFDGAVNAWLTKEVKVQLNQGSNTIQIEKFWGFQHFDYMEIRGDGQEAVSTEDQRPPTGFELGANYPNPFNPATVIPFTLTASGRAELDVLDVSGRVVRRLQSGLLPAGLHLVPFDASGLSSGVYLYRLRAQGHTLIRKMTLIK